ncbi:MAG: DNA/RNA non-specific endonuclease [Bacteroidales bacterium]|nr:DNA/RNA non-specific endonuclease [Bacteroidales bacterium]
MKPSRLLIFFAVLAFALSACGQPEPEKQTVSVSPSSVSFKTEGGSEIISVTSNANWYVQSDGSWVKLSATAGSGNGTVTVSVDANTGDARNATLTFKTADQAVTVSVSQDMYVNPGPTQKSIREIRTLYKGNDYIITEDIVIEGLIISDYRRDTDGGLNNYSSAKTIVISDGDAGLMLYCTADNKVFARGQRIRVKLKDQTLSVYANGALQVNGLPLDNIEPAGTGTPAAREITIDQLLTGDYECMYVAVKDVQVAQEHMDKTFATADANTSIKFVGKTGGEFDLFTSRYATFRDERVPTGSGTLKGIAGKYGSRFQLSVSEKNDYAGLTGERFGGVARLSFETTDKAGSGDAGTINITLASSVAWTASSSNSAFAVSPASGSEGGLVTVTYGDNPSTTDTRSAEIVFRTEDPAIAQRELKFTVTQQPYESLVPSAVQAWLELPAVPSSDPDAAFFSHDMTYNGQTVRNYSFLLDLPGRVSRWVAYPLYKGMTTGSTRTDKWEYDPLVPKRYQGVAYKSYAGYDRGHQLPSADRLCNTSANEQTFYFTNITPQHADLNQGLWEKLEQQVRGQINSCDTLYVVTGCVLATTADPTVRTVDDNNGKPVAVPKAYYKVILKYTAGTANGGYSAIGFWMENKAYGETALSRSFARTVDEIETLTGIDFFHNLNDTYEKEAEARYDASAWGL